MKRLLATLLTFCALSVANQARAEDCPTESKATPASTCVVMRRGEVRGIFLSLPTFTTVKQAALDGQDAKVENAKLQEALRLRDNQVLLQQQAIAEQKAANQKLDEALSGQTTQTEKVAKERDEAIAQRDSPWRSPILWTGVGVGATILTIIVAQQVVPHHQP
jgi:hypothetical protein